MRIKSCCRLTSKGETIQQRQKIFLLRIEGRHKNKLLELFLPLKVIQESLVILLPLIILELILPEWPDMTELIFIVNSSQVGANKGLKSLRWMGFHHDKFLIMYCRHWGALGTCDKICSWLPPIPPIQIWASESLDQRYVSHLHSMLG